MFFFGITVDMYKYEINIYLIFVIYLKICVKMSHPYKHFSFIHNFWISISNVFHFFKGSEFTYVNLDPEQCMRCSNFGKDFLNCLNWTRKMSTALNLLYKFVIHALNLYFAIWTFETADKMWLSIFIVICVLFFIIWNDICNA